MNLTELADIVLFRGMTEDELQNCLRELKAEQKEYKKGMLLLHAGDVTERMGLVLSGSVTIESNDVWGNCTILSHVGPGQFFAETYAILPGEVMPVDVRANEDSSILFLTSGPVFRKNPDTPWMNKMIRNLLLVSAHKNLTLSKRSFHTAPKSIRGRVMSYLNSVSLKAGSREFDIPFDRQQLADYLNLERTALSKELGRMQREGLLSFRKNHFLLYEPIEE